MRIVMTLLARNEEDIVDAQLAFHLHAGVDFVVAMNHRSDDATREILERYEQAGWLYVIDELAEEVRQPEWVTRMARLAATEFEADWVINADADEFWWPREGSLKDVLAAIPARFGVVRGCWRHFVPRPDDGSFFAERMTVRLSTPAHPGDKSTIFHVHQKAAHRAHPAVRVDVGNHDAHAQGLEPLRSWHPIEVLHFSIRSPAQAERKFSGGWLLNPDFEAPLHLLHGTAAVREGRLNEHFASLHIDDETLERGLADGTLAIDTRLRDALRELRAPDGQGFALPGAGRRLAFPRPDVHEEALYAAEAAPLAEIDGIVRAGSRADALEERLARLERESLERLGRAASRRWHRFRARAAVD